MRLFRQILIFLIAVGPLTNAMGDEHIKAPAMVAPETEIFLFDIDLGLTENVLSNGRNVTNWPTYDNQPTFTKDSESFVFSRDNGGQTDIYEYFLDSGETIQLTSSDETEYSPTPFPNNQSIAFVSDRTSSIWHGKREDLNNPKPAQTVNNNREPIGYFAWNHKNDDIVYWSQFGYSVTLVNANTKDRHFISGNALPSTPRSVPNTDNFSFVHRQTNTQDWIKEFNPRTKAIRPIAPLVGTNVNYTWTTAGALLLIEENKLYRWKESETQNWVEIAEIPRFLIDRAYRLAISPNSKKLAIVGYPPKPK